MIKLWFFHTSLILCFHENKIADIPVSVDCPKLECQRGGHPNPNSNCQSCLCQLAFAGSVCENLKPLGECSFFPFLFPSHIFLRRHLLHRQICSDYIAKIEVKTYREGYFVVFYTIRSCVKKGSSIVGRV